MIFYKIQNYKFDYCLMHIAVVVDELWNFTEKLFKFLVTREIISSWICENGFV